MFLNFLAITISRQSSTQTCTHTHKHAHTHPFLSNASCQINIFFTSLTGADKCSKASTHTHTNARKHTFLMNLSWTRKKETFNIVAITQTLPISSLSSSHPPLFGHTVITPFMHTQAGRRAPCTASK